MAAVPRRLRALGRRRRRPLSLTERSGAGTRGAMAGGRRGAIARPEQSSRYSVGLPPPHPTLTAPRQPVASRSAAAVGHEQLAPRRCRLTPRVDRGSGGETLIHAIRVQIGRGWTWRRLPKGGGEVEEDVTARVSKQISREQMSRDFCGPATAEERLLFPEVTSIETAQDPGNVGSRRREIGVWLCLGC